MSQSPPSPLRRWRLQEQLSVANAAARVPIARQTWHSWERGQTIPPKPLMQRLFEMTGGAVTANDFYDLPQQDAAPEVRGQQDMAA